MSFFDERVEAYRRYVGSARDDVDAARGRYEMACDDAAAELIDDALDALCLPLSEFESSVSDVGGVIALRWSSPGGRAEIVIYASSPTEATVSFAGEDYGRSFTFDAPLEDAVNLFLAWVEYEHAVRVDATWVGTTSYTFAVRANGEVVHMVEFSRNGFGSVNHSDWAEVVAGVGELHRLRLEAQA